MITRHDNGDGTTTFRGVDVTIPTSVAEKFDVVDVRRPKEGDLLEACEEVHKYAGFETSTYVILAPRPTWKPPSNLPAGEYSWGSCGLANVLDECKSWMFPQETASRFYRDWSSPSVIGRWRVNEDGTATYLGES